MKKIKIHFVGIKGVGMAPLAIIAKEAGLVVTGSDVADSFITDLALTKSGIEPITGFAAENIKKPDLVIISGANGGYDNIEALTAKAKNTKVITQGEAVGFFMGGSVFNRKFESVSIAGTHGKTTTTAMLATILKENKHDPTYVIGTGDVGSLGFPGHYGRGRYFVAEADEYATEPTHNKKPKFMWQFPKIAVITNIEYDHPDIYESIESMRNAYLEFANQLDKNSVLIAYGDDPEIKKLLKDYAGRYITYGLNNDNNFVIDKIHISGDHMFFVISARGTILGEFMLKVVGEHNALNATAAIVASLEMGLSIDKIKKGVLGFTGSKRRLEFIGDLTTGAKVYDDYAHHPTAIKKTLLALRDQYPKKKIIAIFQPHTYSRTKMLFDEFVTSFKHVDAVILTDIYASSRESIDLSVSSDLLADNIKKIQKDVVYLPSNQDVIKYVSEKRFRSDAVVVTMGAGDIYKIHSELKYE